MRAVPRLAGLAALLGAAACNHPMSSYDGISPTAGLAHRENLRIQTVDPYAGDGPGPNPGADGRRALEVTERYRAGPVAGGAAAPDAAAE